MSNDSGWRRFLPRKRSSIIAASVAGVVVVSGAGVSAATLGPGQGGPATAQAQAQHRPAAYHTNSVWGPEQTNADQKLQKQVVHTMAGKKRAVLKREEAQERARKKARAAAKKRAAEAAKKKAHEARASRSDDRKPADDSPSSSSSSSSSHSRSHSSSDSKPSGSPKSIAKQMLADRGWSGQFGCLEKLWEKESGWQVHAANPSGAYGIPQALPGSKMSSAGSDWHNSASTQIKWGLGYISDRYGGPCSAWSHSQSNNWY